MNVNEAGNVELGDFNSKTRRSAGKSKQSSPDLYLFVKRKIFLINTQNLTSSKRMFNTNVLKNILVKYNEDTKLSCHIHVPLSC